MSRVLLAVIGSWLAVCATTTLASMEDSNGWYARDTSGEVVIDLYFYWSEFCPHCHEAKPFVERLAAAHPWLRLHTYEISSNRDHVDHYVELAKRIGEQARSVPAFLFCERMEVGYDDEHGMGKYLLAELEACRRNIQADRAPSADEQQGVALKLPLIGTIDPASFSLPTFTVIIAAIDAFNPCAFFVLLFLLSLLVHARSRSRMLIVGGVFVFFSGLVYFVFMSAWLNMFMLLGEVKLLTLAAGLVAMVVAVINIKDYFWFKQGVSLTLSESAQSGLFARMRRLLSAENLPAMLAGTVVLALLANSYELLCTAGFPMVYTRILTLNDLSTPAYYLYLAAYNLIYIIPLAVIVLIFTLTLGSRKLTEYQGRVLKLISGLMMLGLGLVLVFAPGLLDNVLVALGLLIVAVVMAAAIVLLRRRRPRTSA